MTKKLSEKNEKQTSALIEKCQLPQLSFSAFAGRKFDKKLHK